MTDIYHILGTNILHHNHRLLDFFQQEELTICINQHHFFYVVGDRSLSKRFPKLNIKQFASQYSLAKSLIVKVRQNPKAHFVLHGQFNPWVWLAIAVGLLPTKQIIWHIWGADLYEISTAYKFKLFYPIRRIAQQKIKNIWATRGDLAYVWDKIRSRTENDKLLYFPTKWLSTAQNNKQKNDDRLVILLGNSGDSSNNHIQALNSIKQKLGGNVRIILPMGYPANNERYVHQVEKHSKRLFSAENIQILREKLNFEAYAALLKECDLGYFHFERQQGIGTICLLVEQNIPCALHPENPFCLDMQAENIPFLYTDSIDHFQIKNVKQTLEKMDKKHIAFFYPNYIKLWQERLTELAIS